MNRRSSEPLFLGLHFLIFAVLVAISWVHGLPFLEHEKYVVDIQYFDTTAGLIYIAALVALCLNYFLLIRLPDVENFGRRRLIWCTAFTLVGICALPVNTGDFFSYIEFGRLILVHGLNPYQHGYREVHDPYSAYSWFGYPTNYGPLALSSFLPAAYASQVSALAAFVVLKITWLLIAFLCLRAVYRWSGGNRWFLLFALNPFWLVDGLMNGHNDLIAVFLILLALRFRERTRKIPMIVSAALLPLFKLPLGLIPAYLSLEQWRKGDRRGFFQMVGAVALLVAIILVCVGDPDAIRAFGAQSAPLTIHSFAGRIAWVMQTYVHPDPGLWTLVVKMLPAFGVLGVLSCLAFWAIRKADAVRGLAWTLFFLVFVFATQYWPWYSLWILPVAIFLRDEKFLRLFCIAGFSGFVIYSFPYWEILNESQRNAPDPYEALIVLLPTLVLGGLLIYRLAFAKKRAFSS